MYANDQEEEKLAPIAGVMELPLPKTLSAVSRCSRSVNSLSIWMFIRCAININSGFCSALSTCLYFQGLKAPNALQTRLEDDCVGDLFAPRLLLSLQGYFFKIALKDT